MRQYFIYIKKKLFYYWNEVNVLTASYLWIALHTQGAHTIRRSRSKKYFANCVSRVAFDSIARICIRIRFRTYSIPNKGFCVYKIHVIMIYGGTYQWEIYNVGTPLYGNRLKWFCFSNRCSSYCHQNNFFEKLPHIVCYFCIYLLQSLVIRRPHPHECSLYCLVSQNQSLTGSNIKENIS